MHHRYLRLSVVVSLVVLAGFTPVAGDVVVSGRVLEPSGRGLAGAQIELLPLGDGYPTEAVVTALTGARGAFRLDAPTEGMWVVRAGADGFLHKQILLAPLIEGTELPTVELPRDAGLVVRVVDPAGQPAGGSWVAATVWETAGWNSVPRRARTDDAGYIRWPWASGEQLGLRAYRQGSVESDVVVLRQESGTEAVELRLRGGDRRTLVVTTPEGTRLSGVQVRVGASGWPTGRTDETGRVSVLVPETGSLTVILDAADGRHGQATVSLANEPTVVELSPAATLVGRVVTRGTRAPVPGAVVWHPGDLARFTHSGSGGHYRLIFPAGGKPALTAAAAGYQPAELRVVPGVPTRSAFGRVLDSDENPVLGVEVTFLSEEERVPSACVSESGPIATDDDGTFRFDVICSETLRLTARASGFAPMVVPGLAPPGGDALADADPEPWDLGTLLLTKGTRLVGRVVDQDQIPVVDAEIAIQPEEEMRETLDWEAPLSAKSDNEGRFAFTGLPVVGRVDLTARAPGYAFKEMKGIEDIESELMVVLEPGVRLGGRVLGDDGSSIDRAVVQVKPTPAGSGASRVTITDIEGAFAFDDLERGKVAISATAKGYLRGPELHVELSNESGTTDLELRLTRGNILTGQVSDSHGRPITNAQIETRSQIQTASDTQGRYRLEGVEPGEQVVIARRTGYLHQVERIEVLPGVNVTDFVLDSGLDVSGRLIGGDGTPLPNGRVSLVRQGTLFGEQRVASIFQGMSDAGGVFKVAGLTGGTYQLSAEKKGFATRLLPESVEVQGAPVTGLEVVLERGLSVTGELLGLEFDDLAYVEVSANSSAGVMLNGVVDPTGHYRLDGISPGMWIFVAVVTNTDRRAVVHTEIRPGERDKVIDLDLSDGQVFSGQVLVDGQPVARARVHLRGVVPWVGGTTVTSHNGSFRIEGVESGDYELEITQPTMHLRHLEHLAITGDERRTIEISTSLLSGRVVEAGSALPLADVMLSLEPATGAVAGLPPQVATSDESGRFHYRRVTAGTYRLVGKKPGYATDQAVIEVKAGGAERVEMVLEPTAGLLLRIFRPGGELPHSVDMALLDPTGEATIAGTYPVEAGGLVRLGSVPGGSWRLMVSTGGAAAALLPISVPTDPIDVILGEAAGLQLVVPELQDSALLAQIYLADAQGMSLSLPLPGGAVRRRWSLFYGSAFIGGLPAGPWWIQAIATDGRRWEGMGVAAARSNAQVTLQ